MRRSLSPSFSLQARRSLLLEPLESLKSCSQSSLLMAARMSFLIGTPQHTFTSASNTV